MGTKGGAPKTQTITQTNDPWSGAQGTLSTALNAATQAYNQGAPAYYSGQTVAPMSEFTTAGLNNVAQNAGAASGMANMGSSWLANAAGPRYTPGQGNIATQAAGFQSNPWGSTAAGLTGAAMNNPYAQGVVNASQQTPTGQGMDSLRYAASGGLMQNNPYLDQTFAQGANAIRNQVDAAFNRAGRNFGSANYGDALAHQLGNYATDLYGNAYNTNANITAQAASQLAGYDQNNVDRAMSGYNTAANLYNTGVGQAMQGAGLGGNLYGNDLSQALSAYQALASQGNSQASQQMQAASLLPTMYSMGQQGAADMLGAGQTLDQYNQQLLNADIDRYNYNNNAQRSNIEWLNAIASGQGQLGGTQTSQQPYSQGNSLMSGIGTALGVNSLMGSLGFASGSAGSVIPTILSLFAGGSDRRLKDDIVPVARDPRGFNWYEFRYKWDEPGTVRTGVMADEVEKIIPHAVARNADGIAFVDYGAL